MSNKKSGCTNDDIKGRKRNLPSWTSAKENKNETHGKKVIDTDKGEIPSKITPVFSKLLEGVVFVLSGFVNPERGILRSQALEMGAEYQADWTSDCTLLVCAFPNTPKFRQVKADCGTIVSKEWILECHSQKKLVEIDRFLMHAGKPWRKSNSYSDHEKSQPGKSHEEIEKRTHSKLIGSTKSEGEASNAAVVCVFPSKVKEWAFDDLNKTISWLDSQEEKPDPRDLKRIAAEGILICLEDVIAALKEKTDIRHVTDQWKFVPHVVEELAKLDDTSGTGSLSKEELSERAVTCKRIYEAEFNNAETSLVKGKKLKRVEGNEYDDRKMEVRPDDAGFDSDETIVMTEEEIDHAC